MATSALMLMVVFFGFLPLSILAVAYLRDIRAILRDVHGRSPAKSSPEPIGGEDDGA